MAQWFEDYHITTQADSSLNKYEIFIDLPNSANPNKTNIHIDLKNAQDYADLGSILFACFEELNRE